MQSKAKTTKHLPLFDVDPLYYFGIVILTAIAIVLSENGYFFTGKITWICSLMYSIGFLLLIVAVYIWISAVVVSQINDQIKKID